MKFRFTKLTALIALGVIIIGVLISFTVAVISLRPKADAVYSGTLITLYDKGEKQAFVTSKATLKEAFEEQNIVLDAKDAVEPALSEALVAKDYQVNIYRARPVTVIDGASRQQILTPYQSATRIVKDVGVQLYAEDTARVSRATNMLADGAGLEITIDRATSFIFDLYGNTTEARTQGATIAQMLAEKKITFGDKDRSSLALDTPISPGMQVRIWREGKQTITVDEPIAFETEKIRDADRPIGYKAVQTAGKNGISAVSYEVEIKDGVELSRTKLAAVTKAQPVKQVEVVGVKYNGTGLTKGMGVKMFTDSNGVVHRETYYDLPMAVVMTHCGQNGTYSVREDGVKVDSDDYIIVAANYAIYPRCSIVETSLGPGKVYDTGGFALRHPHGFDLATDWTNNNGI